MCTVLHIFVSQKKRLENTFVPVSRNYALEKSIEMKHVLPFRHLIWFNYWRSFYWNDYELWIVIRIHFFKLLLMGHWELFFSFKVWNSWTCFNFFLFAAWPSGSLVSSCPTFFNNIGPRLERWTRSDCYTNKKSWTFQKIWFFSYLKSSFSSFKTPLNCGVFIACSFFGWIRPCIGGGGGGGVGIAEDAIPCCFIIFNSFVRLLSIFSMLFNFAFISINSSAMFASTNA